jgi:hypothetical protein
MNRIRLNSLKVLVFIALLCPAAFADGDMGSGGFTDSDQPAPTVKTQRTLEDGDMGSGGRLSSNTEDRTYFDSVISAIYDYLDSVV